MFGTLAIQAVFVVALFILPAISDARERDMVSINIIVGRDCACGNHTGQCDAEHINDKIDVVWHFPTRIFKGKESVKDWYSVVCPSGSTGSNSLSSAKVKIVGYWIEKNSFEAYEVILGR